MLNDSEKKRYSRHLTLPQVGEKGQLRLKAAKVLVVGAGGLGCPVLQYLAAAGVGHITIVDGDQVSLSNLQRQILFTEQDVGKNKAEVASARLQEMNSNIEVNPVPNFFNLNNALALVESVDLVIDGTDNFQTRYLINDSCVIKKTPFIYASIHQFSGQLAVFNLAAPETNTQPMLGPTYRCLFPEPPSAFDMPSCDEAGVLGVLPGVLGTLQATEALKIILGLAGIKSGILVLLDLLGQISQEIQIAPSKEGQNITILETPEIYCKAIANTQSQARIKNPAEIDPWDFEELKFKQVIDVRSSWEYDSEIQSINIPLSLIEELNTDELSKQFKKLNIQNEITLICSYGKKSMEAQIILKSLYPEYKFKSLSGGIEGLKRLSML